MKIYLHPLTKNVLVDSSRTKFTCYRDKENNELTEFYYGENNKYYDVIKNSKIKGIHNTLLETIVLNSIEVDNYIFEDILEIVDFSKDASCIRYKCKSCINNKVYYITDKYFMEAIQNNKIHGKYLISKFTFTSRGGWCSLKIHN